MFLSSLLFVCVHNRALSLFSDGTVVKLLEARRMRMMRPLTLVGELSLYFCFLVVVLERFF
jgi:hypothetical protein